MNQMNIPNCSSFITPHDDEGQDLGDIPLIRQIDNIRILPKYSSLLSKSGDDRVCMDDLDQLQLDLEKLCSTCTVRIRYLLSEIGEADRNIEGSDHTVHEKKSFKRKLPEEILINPDFRKKMPENENADKFWASIKPYCSSVTNNDITLLDSLINECSKDMNSKIPETGENYSSGWSVDTTNEEPSKPPMKKIACFSDMKKNGLNSMVETFATPLTQRLLAALIEEKVVTNHSTNGESAPPVSNNLKLSESTKLKTSTGGQKVPCIDRRLKKELMELGIISMDDLSKF
ncbi:unnamed protein product [Phaedon cochleariae]|uniref:Uncharacterized protein n=1 Tax=Phaedon cochleariae TaxID=80249 RepID=A0A9N9SGJ2_PHACE|nr:unnamed protein product [Phaedon cochleariae]